MSPADVSGFPSDASSYAATAATAQPGWYPDPQVPGQQRYWDGSQWTDQLAAGYCLSHPEDAARNGYDIDDVQKMFMKLA